MTGPQLPPWAARLAGGQPAAVQAPPRPGITPTVSVPARIRKYAQGTADSGGNVTVAFEQVPTGTVWTGTLQVVSPSIGIGSWSAYINNPDQLVGVFQQPGGIRNVQVGGGETLSVSGTLQGSGTVVTVALQGYASTAAVTPILQPELFGPAGAQFVTNAAGFPIVTQEGGVPNVTGKSIGLDAGTGPSTFFTVPPGATYHLWNVAVSGFLVAANTSASGYAEMDAWIQETGFGVIFCGIALGMFGQTGPAEGSQSADCKGIALGAGDSLTANIGALVTNTHGRAFCTAIWSTT